MGKPIPDTIQRLQNNSEAGVSPPLKDKTINSIIDYLNEQSGNEYLVTSEIKELVEHRFREGFTEQNFMDVIKYKCWQWGSIEDMKPFRRPKTLFGNKMKKYLNEAKSHLSSTLY